LKKLKVGYVELSRCYFESFTKISILKNLEKKSKASKNLSI